MRTPTLHEKITIKGRLAQRGVDGIGWVKDFEMLLHYWYMTYQQPLCLYYLTGPYKPRSLYE